MSKTIEEIKNEIALEKGYLTWEDLCYVYGGNYNKEIIYRYAKDQNKDLVKWKESMMKVHNDLNLQDIGKVLGIKLGSSIAPQVLPSIKDLVDKNNELVEMLNKAKERLYTVESPSTSCRYLADEITELLTKYK